MQAIYGVLSLSVSNVYRQKRIIISSFIFVHIYGRHTHALHKMHSKRNRVGRVRWFVFFVEWKENIEKLRLPALCAPVYVLRAIYCMRYEIYKFVGCASRICCVLYTGIMLLQLSVHFWLFFVFFLFLLFSVSNDNYFMKISVNGSMRNSMEIDRRLGAHTMNILE